MKEMFFHSKFKYLGCFVYGLIIITLKVSLAENFYQILFYSDGAFIAGFSLICVGGLSLCNKAGAFDAFGYTFSRKKPNGARMSYYDYIQLSEKKRKNKNKFASIPYFVVGVFYSLVSVLLIAFL